VPPCAREVIDLSGTCKSKWKAAAVPGAPAPRAAARACADKWPRARAGLPPGAVAVQLSEEEQAAVGRLEAMGFDRQAVLEAFLACDRNETMAANFLLENAGDDM